MTTKTGKKAVKAKKDRKADKADAPLRRCAVTGEQLPQSAMIRFVVGPDAVVVPDFSGKLPGRGIWLSPSRNVIEKACQKNAFARAAKTAARPPEALLDQLEATLEKRCLHTLGLARRSGQLTAGFEKVKAWLSAGKVSVLFQAQDAAEDGKGKLRALARAVNPDLQIVELFDARQLGHALGRDAWVHVALGPGGIADSLVADVARLSAIRTTAASAAR